MQRTLRIQYPGAVYHVMSRGDRLEDIFLDDVDRQDFLNILAEACQHGLQQDTAAARQEFERRLEARRLEPGDEPGLSALRRGWCLGSEDFTKQMLEKRDGELGEHHSGELRRETAEARAERIIAGELGRLGWQETELAARRKSDPAKLGIAVRLRKETTLPIKAIASRIHLGTSKSANARLHAAMRETAPAEAPQGQLGI